MATLGYAFVRPWFDGFFAVIGIRPEEVGYGQVQMLSLGLVVGAFYSVTIAAAGYLCFALYVIGGKRGLVGRIVTITMCLLIALLVRQVESGWPREIAAVLWPPFRTALLIGLTTVVVVLLARTKPSSTVIQSLVNGRGYKITVAVLLLLTLAVNGAAFRFQGQSVAEELLAWPSEFRDRHLIVSTVLVGSLTPVFIVALNRDRIGVCSAPGKAKEIESYLIGRASGGAFVLTFADYGPGENPGKVFWLPASDYAVVTSEFDGGCRSPGQFLDFLPIPLTQAAPPGTASKAPAPGPRTPAPR
ncbi:hypothetical protein [Paractinoplanes globisporus]|uniref:Uncharacterized protein n=1 Tax=Paractinoplanes globisporus TaxID=113565 RepID=A0ABW6WJ41_9ACTN|nr:hypothetical protein [Actinoplanes globisporus]